MPPVRQHRAVRSPTQQDLRPDAVAGLLRDLLDVPVRQAQELTGGGFAAVWRATLDQHVTVPGAEPVSEVVLKVGPPSGTALLTYEADLAAAEATYLRLLADLVPEVPAPRVIAQDDGLVVTTFLPGTPLPDLAPGTRASVQHDVGAALAAVHRVTGERFGYDGHRPNGETWPSAFGAIVEALLSDGGRWQLPAPLPAARVEAALARHEDALAQVRRPALLHFDLWDGNVLALPDEQGVHRMSGIVDGERYVWGDPLVDLVSPVLFGRMEDEPDHPVLAGYAAAAGAQAPDLARDEAARARLALYRVWLHLLMTVEMPSRGMTGPGADGRRDRLARLLDEDLTRLGA